jgi:hypothetical protein
MLAWHAQGPGFNLQYWEKSLLISPTISFLIQQSGVEAADSHTRQRNTCYDSHRPGEGKSGGFRIASLKLFQRPRLSTMPVTF